MNSARGRLNSLSKLFGFFFFLRTFSFSVCFLLHLFSSFTLLCSLLDTKSFIYLAIKCTHTHTHCGDQQEQQVKKGRKAAEVRLCLNLLMLLCRDGYHVIQVHQQAGLDPCTFLNLLLVDIYKKRCARTGK